MITIIGAGKVGGAAALHSAIKAIRRSNSSPGHCRGTSTGRSDGSQSPVI